MKEYKYFVDELSRELQSFLVTPKASWKTKALLYVDGFAADELRRLVNLETRRRSGAFFTSSTLATDVLKHLKPRINNNSIFYDPACGAGNLLVTTADVLSEQGYKEEAKNNFLGTDLHEEFVQAARLRLFINYLLITKKTEISEGEVASIFNKNILKADGLVQNPFYTSATHIIVNPPYNQINSNNGFDWAKGKVSAAAVFLDKIVEHTNPGVNVLAILPDVLRGGSRYEKWRRKIVRECKVEKVKLYGQFDAYADVDVFAISLIKRKKKVFCTETSYFEKDEVIRCSTIKDKFDICVGPVVDNRDAYQGTEYGYVTSKGLEGWSVKVKAENKRKHKGKAFNGPFVVIKRTSRMTDANRAIATIIDIKEPVYVDNHLIILKPISGKINDCVAVLESLKDKRTNDWINAKLRCRHLTVRVVADIPLYY